MADEPVHESPYDQKESDLLGTALVNPDKAYKNEGFLMSRDARNIRILCEFEETLSRLKHEGILGTFLFFGSARAMFRKDWEREIAIAKGKVADKSLNEEQKAQADAKLLRLTRVEWLCPFMEKCKLLSRKLTMWALTEELRTGPVEALPAGGHSLWNPSHSSNYLTEPGGNGGGQRRQRYVVSTGGGPGLMEAANQGAREVAKDARTAGFAISLPFEKGLNPYVTQELAFTFHYFFTRKYWMMYPAKVLIAFPGGFGTFDELFESVTLKQTGKKPPFPVVLFGKDYWSTVVNWEKLCELGTISQADVDNLYITDDVDEAFEYIKSQIANPSSSTIQRPAKRAREGEGPEGGAKRRAGVATLEVPEGLPSIVSPSKRPID
eukprot:TRINITY_DN15588_c0_g1_i1.p2 TRINITY_DN15588_c0_g1~~TRINITY_DN15588_c0_g1_i1.p2  ORF type:complete len:380 (+),score=151.79 TRINITY_DN15588_c0_g1_i1:56-1195(+)